MNPALLGRFLIAGALLAGAAGGAASQAPDDPAAWDSTWIGGWDGGEGSQVIIAGGAVIGFFWGGEYFAIEHSTSLADGGPIKFIWPGGEAVVDGGPDGELILVVNETGKPETGLTLTRE